MQITIDGKTYNLIPCEEDTEDTKDIATKPKKTGYERADFNVVDVLGGKENE